MWYTNSSIRFAIATIEAYMTEAVWDRAFDLLMQNEGGYVNDPKDSGGETKYGISKKQYPDLDIQNLSLEQAKDIYHKDYWHRYKCDYLPDSISIALFDSVVNSSAKKMITLLQESLGVCADGVIGNQTIGACNRLPQKVTVNTFLDLRLKYLMTLKGWKYYGNGWGSRIERVRKCALSMV